MSLKALQWVSDVTVGKGSFKSVLVALSNTHHQENDTCFASISGLVKFTELNWKTVKSAIEYLDKSGFITEIKREGQASKFVLHFDVTTSKIGVGKSGNSGNLSRGTPSKTGAGEIELTASKSGEGDENLTPSKNGMNPLQKRNLPPPNLEDKQVKQVKRDNTSCQGNPKNQPYLKAAQAMWYHIQPITKQPGRPNFETWANDIRLIVERDGEEPQTVWHVFQWANRDPFWQVNILSPSKLRKQFGQLRAKMNQGSSGSPTRGPAGSTRHRSLEDDLSDTSWASGGSS